MNQTEVNLAQNDLGDHMSGIPKEKIICQGAEAVIFKFYRFN
jgi:hypothetical protein